MNKIIFSGYDTFHNADFAIDSPEGYDYYLFLLTRSPGQFLVDGEMRQYPAGSAVLYPPSSPVGYGTCGDCYGDDWIRFESDESFVKNFSRINEPFPVSDVDYCHNLVQLLTWESTMGQYDGAISQLFHILFYKLEDDLLHHESAAHDQELLTLRKSIMNNPQMDWRIADMAKQLHLSMGYLQSLYKQKFGVSCMDDVIRCRVRKAKDLLTNTSETVIAIAAQCGYNNAEHFCRQFKSACGVTPGKYRAAQRAAMPKRIDEIE
jgi:AraC-like DNA-binding protein